MPILSFHSWDVKGNAVLLTPQPHRYCIDPFTFLNNVCLETIHRNHLILSTLPPPRCLNQAAFRYHRLPSDYKNCHSFHKFFRHLHYDHASEDGLVEHSTSRHAQPFEVAGRLRHGLRSSLVLERHNSRCTTLVID